MAKLEISKDQAEQFEALGITVHYSVESGVLRAINKLAAAVPSKKKRGYTLKASSSTHIFFPAGWYQKAEQQASGWQLKAARLLEPHIKGPKSVPRAHVFDVLRQNPTMVEKNRYATMPYALIKKGILKEENQ